MNKEKKIVPELRFPEFASEGDWVELTLGEISDRIEEKVENRKLTTVSISAGVGFVSQAEKFSRDISGQQYKNYVVLRNGDFSYNKGNSKKFPQGCIYKLKEFEEAAVPNAFISFKFKDNYIGDFYQGYFDNNYHGKQLQKFITSGARMDGLLNISPNDFFTILFPTPKNPKEQKKIASFLTSLGELITAHKKRLEALREYKKGLMQNIFPQEGKKIPNLRFSEFKNAKPWTETALNKLVERIVFKNSGILTTTVFTNSATNGIVEQREYFDKDIADKSNLSNYYVVEPGDYVYNPRISNAAPVGPISKNKLNKTGAMSPLYTVFRFKEKNDSFFEYYFKSNHWFESIKKVANTGARFDRISITDSILMGIPILYPESKEQQKIASCLSNLDCLIKEQSDRLNQLREYKKGMIQRLFPNNNF